MPNASYTRADSLKDKSGLDETEEGASQKEIGVSTTDEKVSIESIPDSSISVDTQIPDECQKEVGPLKHDEEVRVLDLEQGYTVKSFGNTLTWGDQQIHELVDEVANIHVITYDRKRKVIVQSTTKKKRITLDRSILNTTEKKLINIEDARTSELIDVGMAISDATLDRPKWDEKELVAAMKELENLRHLAKYYEDTTQAAVYLRSKFKEAYSKFMNERNLFTAKIVEL
jgi:hypothetical protein